MQGFTLLETVITVGILLILAGLITASWPRFRERQAILIAREQLQALFRQAQQQALNEDRDEKCLDTVEEEVFARRRCSDIGVALKEDKILIFADTDGNDNQYTDNDFIVEEHTLPAAVQTTEVDWQSFLFKGQPPSIELYDPKGFLVRSTRTASFTLKIGEASRVLYVSPYGQVEE